jgi:hypothetical protein
MDISVEGLPNGFGAGETAVGRNRMQGKTASAGLATVWFRAKPGGSAVSNQ